MFRRCISLLVIMGLFASQLAAIPHAHAGISAADQQRHDATPHFHGDWFHHGDHTHGHSHGERKHAPTEPPKEEGSEPGENSDGQPLSDGLGGPGHDTSAIFVPIRAGALSTAREQESAASAWQLAAMVPANDGLGDNWPSPCSTPRWHPPDEVLDASDTYLTLRNLRI